jgi:hypothetical protein
MIGGRRRQIRWHVAGGAAALSHSEWVMPEVDLAFIARQLERLVNDVAGLEDDMTVVIARLDRLDATTHSLVTEVRARHSRHDRVAKRVERLEDANLDAPS